MRCPQCGVASLDAADDRCGLCGYSPSDSVAIRARADELREQLQDELSDRFSLIAPLGFSQRSFVYLANAVNRATPVSLKIFPLDRIPGQREIASLEADAERLRALEHPLLLSVLDFGATEKFSWYARDSAQGESLEEIIRRRAPLSVTEALSIAGQLTIALGFLHARNMLHGNLRPSNIFVDKSVARVSDAGIAHSLNSVFGSRRHVPTLETADFMAPELFRTGSATPEADQYALATVLYECLTGRNPFVGDSLDEVRKMHEQSRIPPLGVARPEIPAHVSGAVERAMAANPDSRFPDLSSFGSALNGGRVSVAAEETGDARRSSQVVYIEPDDEETADLRKRRRWPVLLAVLILLAASAGGWYWWDTQQSGEETAPQERWQSSELTIDRFSSGAAESGVRTTPRNLDPASMLDSARAEARARLMPEPPAPAPAPRRTTPRPTAPQPAQVDRTPGSVSVNSTPWGLVYLDGQLLGNSPRINISVTPGEHTVRVVRVGFNTFERTFTVGPGEDVRLTGIVLEERSQ